MDGRPLANRRRLLCVGRRLHAALLSVGAEFLGRTRANDVLPEAAYDRLNSSGISPQQREKHFNSRVGWYRTLKPSSGYERARAMIKHWPDLGILEPVDPPQSYTGTFHVEVAP